MTTLTLEDLHRTATERAGGLSDFGEPDYRVGLEKLLEAAGASEASGRALDRRLEAIAVQALVGRLHSEAGWSRHPDYHSVEVTAPVIIIGLPRSGTTALHQLLSEDEQFQWIPAWLADRPVRRPAREDWHAHPLHRSAVDAYAAQGGDPNHDVPADAAQECLNVMVQSFVSMMFVSSLAVPDYHDWFLRQDERPSYRRFVDNLRLIGGDDRRTWLLKNPSHVFALNALLDVMPDARVIWIHRDPADSIPSGCSLLFRGSAQGVGFTPEELGRHRLRIWSTAATRAEAFRSTRPTDQFHDVDYERFVADPLREVGAAYERFGLELSLSTRTAFEEWVQAHPQDRPGRHSYSLEEYGLSSEAITEAFADYLPRLEQLKKESA